MPVDADNPAKETESRLQSLVALGTNDVVVDAPVANDPVPFSPKDFRRVQVAPQFVETRTKRESVLVFSFWR
jgi:hypothetical protein